MHPVVAHLEPREPGAGPLARLELGDVPRRVVADVAQAIELGVEAGGDDPSVANGDRRRLDDGRLEMRPKRGEVVDLGGELGRERAVDRLDPFAQRGERPEGGTELGEVAGARGAERDSGENPLEVADAAKQALGLRTRPGLDSRADELLPAPHGVPVPERPAEPAREEPAPHRGHGPIEDADERPGRIARDALHDLEIAPGHGIEHHRLLAPLGPKPGDVRQGPTVRGVGVLEGAARRADPELQRLAPEPAEVPGPEVIEEEPACAHRLEQPRWTRRETRMAGQDSVGSPSAGPRVIVRDQDLGRNEPRELGREGVVSLALHDEEISARHVEDREAPLAPRAGIDRREQTIPALLEERVVGDRARGQDPGDLAFDGPAARGRVADLIADRDRDALSQQPREVALGRVRGHPRHRDRPAVRLPAGGEGDAEQLVRAACVVEEELVEVPHLVEEQLVRELRLDAEVLLHDRGMPPDLARGG